MKKINLIIVSLFPVIAFASASSMTIKIDKQQAKQMFTHMTNVQEEGAAGHSYKKGKSILCWRVNADIDDDQGRSIPLEDVRRYQCTLSVDKNGLATPDNRF